MSLDESTCLGCVYLYPSDDPGCDVDVKLWVRASEFANGLDAELFDAVRRWIASDWPFDHPRYPGR